MKNPADLTLRELEVELLAAHGASDKEIARLLNIDVSTAKSHMKHIRRKYAKIGLKKGRHYLMTQEEYEQRMTKLLRLLRAQHKFMEQIARPTRGAVHEFDARGQGQEGGNRVTG